MPRPADAVTFAEAARILGVSLRSAWRLVERGELATHGPRFVAARLSRPEVEALALAHGAGSARAGGILLGHDG